MAHQHAQLRELTDTDVHALGVGAGLLGSGGGGAVEHGAQLLRLALRTRPLRVVRAADLDPEDLVVHAGLVGAPDVIAERLVDAADIATAARLVVEHDGRRLAAVGGLEIGGLNALVAALGAHATGVPLIDGDLMGRAFPRVDQCTLALAQARAAPIGIVGALGERVVIEEAPLARIQPLIAGAAAAMGGAGAVALYPVAAGVLSRHGIAGSYSCALRLGRLFDDVAPSGPAALARALGAELWADGRVEEHEPWLEDAPGVVVISDPEHAVRLDLHEEFLTVGVDGIVRAATPDVIVAVDPSVPVALRTDQIRIGQRIAVLSLPALHAWPPGADRVVGPAAFDLVSQEAS